MAIFASKGDKNDLDIMSIHQSQSNKSSYRVVRSQLCKLLLQSRHTQRDFSLLPAVRPSSIALQSPQENSFHDDVMIQETTTYKIEQ